MTHITSRRSVTSIEHTASDVFLAFWLVLLFKEGKNFIRFFFIVFTYFQRTKLYSFQSLRLGFLLKIFFKFRKFQPRYSRLINYILIKKKVCKLSQSLLSTLRRNLLWQVNPHLSNLFRSVSRSQINISRTVFYLFRVWPVPVPMVSVSSSVSFTFISVTCFSNVRYTLCKTAQNNTLLHSTNE